MKWAISQNKNQAKSIVVQVCVVSLSCDLCKGHVNMKLSSLGKRVYIVRKQYIFSFMKGGEL